MSSVVSGIIRVVIADDDALIRLVIRSALEMSGCAVDEADSGTTALEMLARMRTDVAIIDAHMPGPGLNAMLESIADLADPPAVVVLSGDPSIVSLPEAALGVGPGALTPTLLAKPVDLDLLMGAVGELSRRGAVARSSVQAQTGLPDEPV